MVDFEEASGRAENADIDGIVEFLHETGGVELISFLDQTGYRFDTIDEQLNVSRGIIQDRIKQARKLDLVEPGQVSRDGSIYRVHKITFLGEAIQEQMREIGLSQTHDRLRSLMKDYEDQKAEFSEWLDDSDAVEDRIQKRVSRIAKENYQK